MSKRVEHITGSGLHIRTYYEFMNHESCLSLSPSAYKCLGYMLKNKAIGDDMAVFEFTYKEAVAANICHSSNKFVDVKTELVGHGAIDQVHRGGLKMTSTFRLSSRWKLYGQEGFVVVKYKPGISFNNISK